MRAAGTTLGASSPAYVESVLEACGMGRPGVEENMQPTAAPVRKEELISHWDI
ncbi:hypothetical protein D3C72_2287520 [compost metagenome]